MVLFRRQQPAASDYISLMIQSDTIRKALRGVIDPELGLNIIDIGLVYDVIANEAADGNTDVIVKMTLTSPGCPAGGQITEDVRNVVQDLDGVGHVEVELVWEPYWTPDRMDPRVKAFMGF
jgi:metal-sulfur cluster biosynthetic enzyme